MKKILFAIVALCVCACAQTPDALMPNPRIQFVDPNGVPLAGGFLHSYQAGTSTPLATYHIDTLGSLTPNQNPIVLDSTGSAEVRILPQAYKFVLEDSNHVQIWAVDQVEDVGQILYGQAVLLNPPGAALQVVAGPLQFTTLVLGGGTPLVTTNQSGTGNLCMATGCALVTPSINGIAIPNSPGTYIQVPNSATGTTQGTLTKFSAAVPAWTKHNDKTGSGTGSPQAASAFTSALTNPSLIVVFVTGPAGTFSVADTAGNTFVDCGQGQILFNANANGVQCFYALNISTTGSDIVSFASTGGGAMKVAAMEWTGSALVTPVDVLQNSGANASSGTGGGQNVSSGAATTTGADLVVGFAGVTAGSLTVGTGYTASSLANLEFLTQSTSGALAATWNDGTDNDSYGALMVAFRPFAGASSNAIIAATTDTSGIQGITVSGAGTSGNAVIQQSGTSMCVFDGPTNASDYVQNSTTVAGNCHDTGSTAAPISGGQVIGHVLTTNSVGGTYSVELLGPEFPLGTSGSPQTVCALGIPINVNASTTSPQLLSSCQFNNGVLNANSKSFTVSGTFTANPSSTNASGYFSIGSSPTLISSSAITTETATSVSLITSFQAKCVVTASGTGGTVRCSIITTVQGDTSAVTTSAGAERTFAPINLTGPIYVGDQCSFSAASTSNNCSSGVFIVQQAN